MQHNELDQFVFISNGTIYIGHIESETETEFILTNVKQRIYEFVEDDEYMFVDLFVGDEMTWNKSDISGFGIIKYTPPNQETNEQLNKNNKIVKFNKKGN